MNHNVFRNILLITSDLDASFYRSCNTFTFPIVYNHRSSRDDLKQFFTQYWTSIHRLGIVFHDPSKNCSITFLNNEPLFLPHQDSDNLLFLIDLIKIFSIKHVDFLACNTLKYPSWQSFFDTLAQRSGAKIGASSKKIGNPEFGGDWIMETTKENIVDIYFTPAIMTDWKGTLGTTISASISLDAAYLEYPPNWPITVENGTEDTPIIITITENCSLTYPYFYFWIRSPYVTIDGGGHTLSIDYSPTPGLIQNGSNGMPGYSNVTIKNINIFSNNSVSDESGWLCFSYFGNGAINNMVMDCSSDCLIDGNYSGGIFGTYAGSNGGSLTVSGCYSSGNISGFASGGIFGQNAGSNGGTVIVSNCHSTGILYNEQAGGIFGRYAGYQGTVTATNCYSTGDMNGNYTGGIFGLYAGYQGTATATDCYSTGTIDAEGCGGIFGSYAAQSSGTAMATNCYSVGDINGQSSGGIFGEDAGYNGGTATATNCYSTGIINGEFSGGIFGNQAGFSQGTVTATSCYSTGNMSGIKSGGIFGATAGTSIGTAIATNCYSSGDISGDQSGGIFGISAAFQNGTAIATNCYSTGEISSNLSGGIFGESPASNEGIVTATNCYSTGNISGSYSGGIFGSDVGFQSGAAIATNCYSTGAISGSYSGGITGISFGNNTNNECSLTNCYSIGNITGTNAGGICGANVGFNDISGVYAPVIVIQQCYSWGTITSSAGGICGGDVPQFNYQNTPTVTIFNSYILQSGNLVAETLSILITTLNTYTANGTWNDNSATSALLDVPATFPGSGNIWTSTEANTAFLLSSYISEYTQPIQNVTAGGTTSSGPYSGGTYSIFSINGLTSSVLFSYFTINTTTGVITIFNGTPTNDYQMVVFYQGSYFFISVQISVREENLPCLVKGMRISTPTGDVLVEDLKEGDLVITSCGQSVPITKIMSTIVTGNEETLPYIIKQNSMGIGKPRVDIYLSKNHEYYYKNHWRLPKKSALERREDLRGKEIEYFHIKTENYRKDKLWCEGIIVDSWKDE